MDESLKDVIRCNMSLIRFIISWAGSTTVLLSLFHPGKRSEKASTSVNGSCFCFSFIAVAVRVSSSLALFILRPDAIASVMVIFPGGLASCIFLMSFQLELESTLLNSSLKCCRCWLSEGVRVMAPMYLVVPCIRQPFCVHHGQAPSKAPTPLLHIPEGIPTTSSSCKGTIITLTKRSVILTRSKLILTKHAEYPTKRNYFTNLVRNSNFFVNSFPNIKTYIVKESCTVTSCYMYLVTTQANAHAQQLQYNII